MKPANYLLSILLLFTAASFAQNSETTTKVVKKTHLPIYHRHQRQLDSTYVPGYLIMKKYFFRAGFHVSFTGVGLHVLNGYKFGRFNYWALGIGFESLEFGKNQDNIVGPPNTNFSGGDYFSIYLHHEGDILKKRITPFYYAEFGFNQAVRPKALTYRPESDIHFGGPMAAVGFGGKFNTKRKASFTLSLNLTYRSDFYRSTYTITDANGVPSPTTSRGSKYNISPRLQFGAGF